jgi:hypothetical protein
MTTRAQETKSWHGWAAWGLFLLTFALIFGDVVRRPMDHTTMPTYRFAATQWWKGLDPYTFDQQGALPAVKPDSSTPEWMIHHDQFLYFPQAAVLFTPFNVVPFMAGEFLWRVVTLGLFAYALVRLNAFFPAGRDAGRSFFFLCLLVIPSSFASFRNAQFDLPLAALIVLAAAEIASARWTAAAAWLCLALVLKPIAVVPMLLFGALYWKLIPRCIVGVLIVLAVPFLHWSPAFVAHEYGRCLQALGWASGGEAPKFSDVFALISKAGWDAPQPVRTAVRVIFALVYLGLSAMAVRALPNFKAAWVVGALSADYLMLFNPRTETCSYVFLGPWIASLALYYGAQPGSKWLGRVLGFGAICLACDAFPKLGAFSIHDMTDRWLKPLMALLFLPVVVEFVLRDSSVTMGRGATVDTTRQ